MWLAGLALATGAGAQIPAGVSSRGAADLRIVGGADQNSGFSFGEGPAGDLDGDGFDDVIIPAAIDDEAAPDAGAAYVLYGPLPAGRLSLASADAKLLGELAGDYAGEGWAGVGDLDGDGLDDVVIGAPGRVPEFGQPGVPAPGAAYLFYGRRHRLAGTISLAQADAKLVGVTDQDYAAVSLAGTVDVDADGLDDLVIGAPGDDEGGPQAGAIYIVRGHHRRLRGTVSLAQADAKLLGAPGDMAGWPVVGAGHVNRDRFEDLLIAAVADPAFGGDGNPSAYLAYTKRRLRGTTPLARSSTRFVPDRTEDLGVFDVAGGDLDGDGHEDIAIGAAQLDEGGLNAGGAYVFYGKGHRFPPTVPVSRADAKLLGEAAGDNTGEWLATPDLNADCRAELVVGAPRHDAAGDRSGAAYVLFGDRRQLPGVLSLRAADTKLVGEAAINFAGAPVGAAGDVNADGVGDLMIASPAYSVNAETRNAGATYILFGSRDAPHRDHGPRKRRDCRKR